MKKLLLVIFLLPTAGFAEKVRTIKNFDTGRLDFITVLDTSSIQGSGVTVTTTSLGVLITGTGGSVSISTLTAGATNFVFSNATSLQAGATFYVSSGTATNLNGQFGTWRATGDTDNLLRLFGYGVGGTYTGDLLQWRDKDGRTGKINFRGAFIGPGALGTIDFQEMDFSVIGYANFSTIRVNGSDTADNHIFQRTAGKNLGLSVPDGLNKIVFRTDARRIATVGMVSTLLDPAIIFWSQAGTATDREQFAIANTWSDGTDATRKAHTNFNIYDTSARTFLSADTDGTNPYTTFIGSVTFTSTVAVRGSLDAGGFGTSGQVLQSNGPNAAPSWATATGGGGASSLEVFSNYSVVRTSPTASLGVGNGLAASVSGSTFTFKVDYSSVPSRSDAVLVNPPSPPQSGSFNIAGGSITANDGFYLVGTGGSSQSQLYAHFVPLPRAGGFGPQEQEVVLYNLANYDAGNDTAGAFYFVSSTVPRGSQNLYPSSSNGKSVALALDPHGSDGNGSISWINNGTVRLVVNPSSMTLTALEIFDSNYNCSGKLNSGKVTVDSSGHFLCADDISGGAPSPVAVGTGTTTNFTTNVTSPTAAISFLGTQFKAVANGTTIFISADPSSFTMLGPDLSATYMTQSSATLNYLTLSSATANYMTPSSTTANYLTLSSASATYQYKGNYLTSVTGFGPPIAVGTGTAGNFTNNVSSPAYAISFLGQQHFVTVVGSTAIVTIDTVTQNGVVGISSANANFLSFSSATATYQPKGNYFTSVTGFGPPIAFGTGTASNMTATISSPAYAASFLGTQFRGTASGTTVFYAVEPDSVTLQGQLFAGSNMTLSVGTHGTTVTNNTPQVLIGGASNYIANQTTMTVRATQGIVTSSLTVNNGLYINQAVKTSNYTLAATDSVILTSCTASGGCTMTIPSGLPTNQLFTFVKVDSSSQAATISTSGSELLFGTTNQTYLFAMNASGSVAYDGQNRWWPKGKWPSIPPTVGIYSDPNTAQGVATSSNTNYVAVYVPEPCTAYGLRFVVGVAAGKIDAGLFDANTSTGAPMNKLASTGSITTPAAGIDSVTFTSDVNLMPGTYWMAIQPSEVTTTIARAGIDQLMGCVTQANTGATLPTLASSTSNTNARPWAIALLLRHATNQ